MAAADIKTPAQNALIAALPADERQALLGISERVPLTVGHILIQEERPVEHVWFPCRGVASLLSRMTDGASVEVATVGREGFVGLPVVLNATAMNIRVIAQVPGEAQRVAVDAFRSVLGRSPALNQLLLRYALALVMQIAQGSACNRLHAIEARCARWLLMTHDRVEGDTFLLTQEFLSQMLGVTRPTVTIAAGILQKAGLISYSRGYMEILDRKGLEDTACECYVSTRASSKG